MKKILIGIFLFLLCVPCFGAKIPEPPPIQDKDVRTYLKTLYDNYNQLEVVIVNPDGARNGRYGDMVILSTGGNYYLEVCMSSPDGTVWRGTQLTDLP